MSKLLAKQLNVFERKTLIAIGNNNKTINFKDILIKTKLSELEQMRAIQWLNNKKLLDFKKDISEKFVLNKKILYHNKLPEVIMLNSIIKLAKKPLNFINVSNLKLDFDKQLFNIALGTLRKNNVIVISKKNNEMTVGLTQDYTNYLKTLKNISIVINKLPILSSKLNIDEKKIVKDLSRRNIIIKENIKKITIQLTKLGLKTIESNKKEINNFDLIEKIDENIIRNKLWNKKEIRAYDISINVPKINYGKRHFVKQAIKSAKRIWLDMGFKEMHGNMVQTSFWNFDALFTAQDHPVREMQDTFFIKDPKEGKLPNKKLVQEVKNAHEFGGNTGSSGWNYKWDEKKSKTNVLRTHTTCLSAHQINQVSKKDLPAKFFSVGKCFRNETVDWSHLFEFNQTEGIVIDPNANFRNLLGYLKLFFKKMGYANARFRPAYFPYTEFSVEVDVLHPIHNKWFELGGAGILRPEVVKPLLGLDIPVLAWGPGFDRIILEYYKITDIRDLYKNDLKQLREMKTWLK